MKKILLCAIIFLTASCDRMMQDLSCTPPTDAQQDYAKELYNSFGTVIAKNIKPQEAKKLFGCLYHPGDVIYSYKTLWGEKLILMSYGRVVTWAQRGSRR